MTFIYTAQIRKKTDTCLFENISYSCVFVWTLGRMNLLLVFSAYESE